MCGICGLVWKGRGPVGSKETATAVTKAMMAAMKHRGPDGSGLYATERFAIGHRRLAIIDVEGAPQPMWSPSNDIAIVYNGEVYNFSELKQAQADRGWFFKTRSDTETLLAGFALNGADFDHALNGMYAYAIADTRKGHERLQLGIDPVGIKPLFVWENDTAVVFASELRGMIAALRALGVPVSANANSLSAFLTLGWGPQPHTLLSGVRKMPPGGRLQVDLNSGKVTELACRALPEPASRDLKSLLQDVVQRQAISDVPLGFFLSGGIDSSLLVAVAQRIGIKPRTFTVRFVGDGHGIADFDEADVARHVANACGAEHHELAVSAATLRDNMDDTFAAMDQPIADPACLPLLVMSRFAREHVKVCLTGDGGDEMFQGYPRHAHAAMKAYWQGVPRPLRAAMRGVARRLPTSPSTGLPERLRKLGVGFSILDDPSYVIGPFSGTHARFLSHLPVLPQWAHNIENDNAALFHADTRGQLSGQMLPKTDHIGMYASLECRVPYLDSEMVALAKSLTTAQKRQRGIGKIPLRTLLSEFLPSDIVDRPKQGFRVPLTDWFRCEMADTVRSRLLDPDNPLAGIISRTNVEQIIEAHIAGRSENSIRIWAMLALQTWLDHNDVETVAIQ